ncbi:putative flagellar hook-length control protein (plasmid) [Octadecabacter arcticus 238]|uniref:Putative flagellar hook-length control protein n=1 Tax=Octadecabacter arcticus 238 TaxID=391616 RepID=M9RW65_9RHOB|nr:flagellar hook-length control protein FliK [Octadecabacter arcticus]AGI74746.1 putative flagellar hook-length control protein [Octadecabacter arcticus 238]
MMASPLTKVPSTAAALDWTTKTGIQAEISVDLLSPDIFSEMVAYFDNEAVAGSSVNVIPREKEPAADAGVAPVFPLQGDPADLMTITRLLPFVIGNALSKHEASNDIQLSAPQIGGDIAPTSEVTLATFLANLHELISDLLPRDELGGPLNIADLLTAPDGQDAVLDIMVSEQGAVLTQALPSALQPSEGTLTSAQPFGDKKLALNDNLLTAPDGQGAVLGIMVSEQGAVLTQTLPSAPQPSEGTLTSAQPLGDKKLALNDNLLTAPDGQGAVLGIMVSEQGAVLTQTLPSAPQPSEGTLTSAQPLGDKKLELNDNLLTAPDGQGAVLGIMVSEQGPVLTQTLPSAPQPSEGTLTSAQPLGDKKLASIDNKIPVETTLKSIGTFTKSNMEDLPVVPARMVVSVGATPLPEKAVSQTVAPTILRDSGLQAAASDALSNTSLKGEIGLGKKQSAFADPSAMATPQAATPPSIPIQPVMSDLTRLVATSPAREAPSVSNASALETVATISGVDTAPGGTGGQSQGGNAQTSTGTNSQQGMAQSQALATVLDVQRQGWTKALVNRAMSMVQSGGTMTFKVMPAHLGMITLKLSEGRRGTDLRIVADVAATASMLRDVKHQISSAFESAGITLGEYSAGTSDRGDKGSTSRDYDIIEGDIEPKIKLNQDFTEMSDNSNDDHSSINIIL